MANQIDRHFGQPFVSTQSPAVFDRDAVALDVAAFLKAVAQCNYARPQFCWRSTVEKADDGQRPLRTRRERPRRRHAPDERNELTPSHDFVSPPRRNLPAKVGWVGVKQKQTL
jgi:hypothetical protein